MRMTSRRNGYLSALEGRALTLAYVVWFVAAVMAVFIFVVSLTVIPSIVEVGGFFGPETEIVAPDVVVRVTALLSAAIVTLSTLLCMILSVLLFWRAERTFMVVFTSVYLLGFGVILIGGLEAAVRVLPGPFTPTFEDVVWAWFLSFGGAWLLWIFPNGQYVPGWTRYLVLPLLVLTGVFTISTQGGTGTDTPGEIILETILTVILVLSFIAQIVRYIWVSGRTERQQMRWVLIGIVLMVVLSNLGSIGYTDDPTAPVTSERLISGVIWSISFAVIPVVLTLAVLRYRLWAVDLIIRRTLQYALITVLLASVYFGGVVLLQSVFVRITGQESPLAIVASTLAIAALFNPVRSRVQNFIDRRFDRRKYDAQHTLDEFAASARDEVDIGRLQRSLVNVVEETMQPESVSLWIQGEG